MMSRSLYASLVLFALAACGGGTGGNTPTSATSHSATASSLIGSWKACFNDGTSSEEEQFVFSNASPASETELTFSFDYKTFASIDCSGTANSSETYTGKMTLDGTKRIGTENAERVTLHIQTPSVETVKQVFVVSSSHFKAGEDPTTDRDADGYPNNLQTSGMFVKQ